MRRKINVWNGMGLPGRHQDGVLRRASVARPSFVGMINFTSLIRRARQLPDELGFFFAVGLAIRAENFMEPYRGLAVRVGMLP